MLEFTSQRIAGSFPASQEFWTTPSQVFHRDSLHRLHNSINVSGETGSLNYLSGKGGQGATKLPTPVGVTPIQKCMDVCVGGLKMYPF